MKRAASLAAVALALSLCACRVGPLSITWGVASLHEQHACAAQAAWAVRNFSGLHETEELMAAHYDAARSRCLVQFMFQDTDDSTFGQVVMDANTGKEMAFATWFGSTGPGWFNDGTKDGTFDDYERAADRLMEGR